MDRTLSSRTSRVGDIFTATVAIPVYVGGKMVIPAGAVVEGRVTAVTPAKRMNKSGTIAIDFDSIKFPNGSRTQLVGILTSDDPNDPSSADDEGQVGGTSRKRAAVFIGGGGALGAVLGGIAGGGKGAAVGGIAGAGAGVAAVLLSKGEEAEVPAGSAFGIQLSQPLVISEDSILDDPGNNGVGAPPDPVHDQDQGTLPTEPAPAQPAPPPVTTASESSPLPLSSPEMLRRAQNTLREQGYYEGDADGVMDSRTSDALRTYQREHNLPETGDLDPSTAEALGITNGRRAAVPRTPASVPQATELAYVLSATASRITGDSIRVLIDTQANTAGWRWFGDHVVNGDTLEVYARAVRPRTPSAQVLTRGRIDLVVDDGVHYVTRVVVHGANGSTNATLAPSSGPKRDNPTGVDLQRQADYLLAETERALGVTIGNSGQLTVDGAGRLGSDEVDLLFAMNGYAKAAQLYGAMAGSLGDPKSLRSAALALAREARLTDRVMTTSSSRAVASLASKWDAARQEVLRLMKTYGIASTELDY
jgi:peptidoglycan hydrolase-like protein with peptidoglycan-binding domain